MGEGYGAGTSSVNTASRCHHSNLPFRTDLDIRHPGSREWEGGGKHSQLASNGSRGGGGAGWPWGSGRAGHLLLNDKKKLPFKNAG